MRLPSGATISRTLIPVDVFMCQLNQERYRDRIDGHFFNVVTDSSPQGGVDWQLTQFTSMPRPFVCFGSASWVTIQTSWLSGSVT